MSLEGLVITDQRLGEGGFGSVFVCELGRKKVAAKKLSQSKEEIGNLVRETSRLKRLEHGKHIAYTYEIIIRGENLYMVMEYSERGDLQNYLKANKDSVTYEQKIFFCRGILLGLLYCHSMEIFHGDIKCSNVILGKNVEPKLTDFGLSMTVDNIEGYCKTYEGSIHWAAPELFSIKEESGFEEFKANPYPTDVYSLGATFCQVSFDGTTEFIDSEDIEMDISLGLVSPISNDGFLEEIIDGCCQFERNERISLNECLSVLDNLVEAQLPVPEIDDKWQEIQQDIKTSSKLELPPSFILHRPTENLVVGLSNLSLLEWLCINNCIGAVKYMIQPYKDNQDQIKWLCEISELCKSSEVANFLKSHMRGIKPSHSVLSNLIDKHPQQFVEMLIKSGADCCSYNLLKKAIKKHHNMTVQAIIDSKNDFKDWAIHDAIKFGNSEAVKMLANASADRGGGINEHTGNALLKLAIDIGNTEIVKSLLEFGIDVNDENDSTQTSVETKNQHKPLYLAALKGNREIVELLIKAGATTDTESHEWRSLSQSLEKQGDINIIRFIRNSISKRSDTVEINPLCAAIRDKQPDLVQTLISDEENIDEIGLDGYAPLHWAVIVGDEEIVKALIKAGVDLDIKSSNEVQSLHSAPLPDYFSECTPLRIAVSKRNFGIAKVLIESDADFSVKNGLQQTIMGIAKGNKKEIEGIIRECAPINVTSMRRAMKSMSHESIKTMINEQQANAEILSECLCIAASSGKNDLVKYLLECGANFNKEHRGKTPLEWAIFGENIQVIKILINAGADINAKNPDGTTLLIYCVKESNIEMVRFLVDKGADMNARDTDGKPPIHHTDDKKILKILINAGADIDAKNQFGATLLIQNIRKPDKVMVQFLVDEGADVNAKNRYGKSPIYYTKDKEIIKILTNAGAKVDIQNEDEMSLLFQYIRKSNTEMVRSLVEKGANVNARNVYGNTLIHYAKDREIIEIFINAGANINAKNRRGETPLIQYVKESNTEIIQLLVCKGADVNIKDEYGNAAICYANNKEVVKVLINAGANPNAKNRFGATLLIQNIRESDREMVRFLVDKGADVNVRDKYENIPISCTHNKEIVKILINAGADINSKNPDGTTLLVQNISGSNAEMVQFLVDKGADVNVRDEYGNTPVRYVKNREIMEILINAGANINVKNQYGATLLSQNIRESNREVVRFLIDKGADLNARDEYENAPIHYANDKIIIEILINAGADINAKNSYGITPLIQYVRRSDTAMVRFLVDKGVDVNARDTYGKAPIDYANGKEVIEILINAGAKIDVQNEDEMSLLFFEYIRKSNREIVQPLVDKGVDVNVRDADGNAPIHYANDKEILKILINAGADINARNPDGTTLLIQNIRESNREMVQFLVNKGADVNARDAYGNAPIHYTDDKEIIETLINANADISANNSDGETPLIQFVKESNAEMVRFLLSKGADVNTRNQRGFTPIHYAKSRGVAEILVAHGADINTKGANGRTPLFECVEESLIDMVKFLVKKGADVNVKDENGNAFIHLVRDRKIAEILINAGADVNAKKQNGITRLIQCIKESDIKMVQFLVDKRADVNARSEKGPAPIHYAGNREIMEILINAGADIDAKDQNGMTSLIQYVSESDTTMVQFLVNKGADVDIRDAYGNAVIHCTYERKIIEVLINAGADVNAKDSFGTTHLIQHVKESDTEMVQFLVDKRADVNVGDKDGNVPIHYAKSREIMEILINAGADINAKNQNGITHLIQNIRKSNTKMVRFLVDKGADVNAGDKDGNTPFHYTKDREIMEILINADADINASNQNGETPLIQHVKESDAEMVHFLLGKGAGVNTRNQKGFTPIHYAKSRRVAEILVAHGADINAKSTNGRTPLFECVEESLIDMVKFLIEKEADVNVRDVYGSVPIHFVRDKEIAEILINVGADINAKNEQKEELFSILINEQNRNLSNKQYKGKKVCELLEYLRNRNKN